MPKKKTGKEKARVYEVSQKAVKIPAGRVLTNKVIVDKDFGPLLERAYGKQADGRLELALVEALYLLSKGRIRLAEGKKAVNFSEFMVRAIKLDPRLHEKFTVYADLRDRGLVVKTGFKFSCDFRVYRRGVTLKEGPKAPGEHTKWIVFAVPEDYTCAFQELSRAVRLAHSIRARMLWGIVDNENNVTYLEVVRMKP